MFNARYLTPLISRLRPAQAYEVIRYTGRFGKGLDGPSFRFPYSSSGHALESVSELLGVDRRGAEEIIRRFHIIETRVLLEHIWLAEYKTGHISQVIDMEDISALAKTLKERGPMLLLTAHTAYYFLVPWALESIGCRIAFMMSDPRSPGHEEHLLTGIESFLALSQRIPIIFTNEGNTVNKSVELLKKGYSILMVIDVPGYRQRGEKVRLLGKDIWVPEGCKWIAKEAQVPSAYVFSKVEGTANPYRLSFLEDPGAPGGVDLKKWAAALEDVILSSPASWLGWFYVKDMM